MANPRTPAPSAPEEFLASLTAAAYQVALQHGLKGPFIDVELDLWRALREAVRRAGTGGAGEGLAWPA